MHDQLGCTKLALCGVEGNSECNRAGIVASMRTKCGHQGCTKRASCGADGNKKEGFHVVHKRAGKVDAAHDVTTAVTTSSRLMA